MTTNYRVRIKPDTRYGNRRQYGPGDELEVTDAEVQAFGDKFIVLGPVPAGHEIEPSPETAVEPEPAAFDAKTASAAEVLEAVASGLITADEALEAEYGRSRGPRKTVLEALEEAG